MSEVNTCLEVEAVPAASDPSAGANSNTVEAEKKPIQISTAEAIKIARSIISETDGVKYREDGKKQLYCPECYLPLHPDSKSKQLYIFLHALRYTTSLGCFEMEMPEWSAEGWTLTDGFGRIMKIIRYTYAS
ncbi:hypothetical protein K435DRAFT_664014 [Dendrothele bispora CBS 962.96]|uniref:Uncharacterized protein n=1 Tax=Dendrothele bispora (strain CBS 962.96) TaxID=1314807 RepID=A0A4S8M3C8_DENBC|nr:hypothetical protein K435DRAFT_664014 [Dendrothele bispora CBS 962.96]